MMLDYGRLETNVETSGRGAMDLKDFVAGSLTQIIEGIRKAQADSTDSGAWISPTGYSLAGRKETPILKTATGEAYLHEVHFDVAVTVSDEQAAGAGAGLRVFGAKLGAEGSVTYQNAAVSRVQFSVPVVWPGQTQPEREKRLEQERREEDEAVRALNMGQSGGPQGWMG
jgi:hypothetical protein